MPVANQKGVRVTTAIIGVGNLGRTVARHLVGGGESVVSWLLALAEIRELYRVGNPAMKPKVIRELRGEAPNTSTTR